MKNIFKLSFVSLIVMFAVIGLLFAACKKDHLDKTTWIGSFGDITASFTFNSPDLTYHISDGDYNESIMGTYTISDNKVNITMMDVSMELTLSGKTLSGGGIVFTKQ